MMEFFKESNYFTKNSVYFFIKPDLNLSQTQILTLKLTLNLSITEVLTQSLILTLKKIAQIFLQYLIQINNNNANWYSR